MIGGDAPVSLVLTPKANRIENGFTWGPIKEVAKLFAGIFISIIPVLAMLQAGREGAFAPLVALVTNPDGSANNAAYFWLAGGAVVVPRQCADLSRVLRARRRRSRHADDRRAR